MSKKLINIAKILFFIGLGVLLIWLVLRNLTAKDKEEIRLAFLDANYWWIGASVLFGYFSHLVRALRWKILLQSLQHKPSTATTFYAVMVGYLANTAVPRLGEISRCGVLTRYENIPFEESFGTVVAERLIDIMTLLAIFIFVIWWHFDTLFEYANQNVFVPLFLKFPFLKHTTTWLFVALLIAVIAVLFFILSKQKKKKEETKPSKIKKIITGFISGIAAVKSVKKPFLFWFYSFAVWFLYYLAMQVSFYAFEQTSHLGISIALTCMAFGSVGFIAVQGGIGAYPLIIMQVLALFGISSSIGYAFGWVVWCASTLVILILGFLSLILLPLSGKNKRKNT